MDKNPKLKRLVADPSSPLLTVKEAADWLRLSLSKVYTMLDYRCSGGIPTVHFGKSVRIRPRDLIQWVERYPTKSKQAEGVHNGGKEC